MEISGNCVLQTAVETSLWKSQAAILINLQTAVADIATETNRGANRYENCSHCLEIMWISPHLVMESGTVSGINRYRN